MRGEAANVEDIARSHHDLACHLPQLAFVEIGEPDATGYLSCVEAPALLASHVNDKDVVGVEVPAVCSGSR